MDDDIIRSLPSAAGDSIVPETLDDGGDAAMVKCDWSGLSDAPASSRHAARVIHAPAWSFGDAIARIDATAPVRRTQITSLQDKVKVVAASRERRAAVAGEWAAAGEKRLREEEENRHKAAAGDDEDDEVDQGSDDDAEGVDDGEDDGDGEGDEDEDDEGDDDDDDDDDSSADDEDEGDEGEEEEEEGEAAQPPATSKDSDVMEGDVDVEAIIAEARPNPHRQAAAAAIDSEQASAYAAYFSADPFSLAARAKAAQAAATANKAARKNGASAGAASDNIRQIPVKRAEAGEAEAPSGGASAPPGGPVEPSVFSEMNLSRPLLKAVAALGFSKPTRIQRRCVPLALAGHDICASAVTGSGKTAAYLLPLLERLLYKPTGPAGAAIRAIILVPTRELAAQVHSMASQLSSFCAGRVRACLVVGGLSLKAQEAELRTRPDIVIATPGRLLDHIRNSLGVHVDDVDVLVLDEADRLLDMGFEAELSEIVKACPVGRQTLLFSATMTAKVEDLARLSLRRPVRVEADALHDMANRLVQEFVRVRAGRERDREPMLLALLDRSFTGSGILVFTGKKHQAHRLAILLGLAGLSVAELHGNLTQRARLEALEHFRTGAADILVATDLAGRGLDISGVRVVINDDMPRDLSTYVHRVGRTARAGRAGVSVTLVTENSRALMKEVVKRAALNVRARAVPPDVVAAYRAKIESMEDDVARVLKAEADEKEIRLAETQLARAENMLEHEDEIQARPARSWILTGKEKAAVREKSAAFARGDAVTAASKEDGAEDSRAPRPKAAEKGHRLTRVKRRRLEALRVAEREGRNLEKLESDVGEKRARLAEEGEGDNEAGFAADEGRLRSAKKAANRMARATHGQGRIAREAKKKARSAAVGLGMSMGQAKHVMKKKERAAAGKGGGGAFSADRKQKGPRKSGAGR